MILTAPSCQNPPQELLAWADQDTLSGHVLRHPRHPRYIEVGLLRLSHDPSDKNGMTFWLAAPTALLVAVHQRYRAENVGDFGTHLKLVLALSGVGHSGLCRRHAFGFLKAYPHEYWAANLYLRAFASDRWRFKLLHFMLDGYPSQLGRSANIVLTAQRPDSAPADVRAKVVAAASRLLRRDQTGSPLSGWDAVFLAKTLLLFGSLDLAYRAIEGACLPENDTAIRFEGLLTVARIVAQGPAGLLAHVRCLVTATRIYPDHVGIKEVLRKLADLLDTMGLLRVSQDTLELELGRCQGHSVLITGFPERVADRS